MKFVHLADVHLDMVFSSIKNNRELIKKRRMEQKRIFKDAIDLVKDERAEFLFIAGDLFEQKYVEDETIKYIISLISKIPDVHVFISPGNHDPLIKNSPYNTYEWPENVIIFGEEFGKYSFENIDIYGFGFENYEMDVNVLENIEIEDESKINILVSHGTLDGATHKYNDMKSKLISKFDYVALGHIHMAKIDDSRIIYPGSLIAGGFDELGEHGLVIGEISKNKLDIKFKKMDYRQFEIKGIDITNLKTANEIIDALELKDNIYRIIFTGDRNIDVVALEDVLKNNCMYISEIIDDTKPSYDFERIAMQKNLKGIFTKNMLQKAKEQPEIESEIVRAIEIVYKNM